ncbi:MAG: long-chain fatty acid--CoA ligase [Deltaproteobacteria bacterium]|nr:long-chain fatty acid--CoA ligase [Deltaproteobacteria bacterium]
MMNWSLVLKRNAERYPDKECLTGLGNRYTYRQLHERVDSLAQSLLDIGLGKGDVVAILLYNCLEYIEMTFAINKIGAVWLPLNFRLVSTEFSYILNHSEAKAVITEPDFVPTISSIQGELPNLKNFIQLGPDTPEGWLNYDGLIERNRGANPPDVEVNIDDLHRLMYTSGTTADPKGVMLSYGNLYWKNIGHILEFNMTEADRTLVVGPLYHVGGMDLPGTGTLYCGGSLVILKRFDPIEVLKAIDQEKVTNLWLSPAMTIMLFNEPTFDRYDVSSVRFIIDGGEKMPVTLIEKFKEKFPTAWFADAYGLTETVSGDTFLAKDKMLHKIGSVGKPVSHLQVRILDSEGNDVGPNETGEICLKGPKVFKGYWKNPDATKEAMRGGWFHTGDVGMLDEDGFLYIVDRIKDMIISGGENIASPEVEKIIYELPEVLETAVVGIPHPKWLEVPKAYVVLKEGAELTAEKIVQHCAKKMAKFKVPKEIEFIDALPRNPSGKVLKRELREMHARKGGSN